MDAHRADFFEMSPDSVFISSAESSPQKNEERSDNGRAGRDGSAVSASPPTRLAMPCVLHEPSVQSISDDDNDVLVNLMASKESDHSTPQHLSSGESVVCIEGPKRGRPTTKRAEPKRKAQRTKIKTRAASAAPRVKRNQNSKTNEKQKSENP